MRQGDYKLIRFYDDGHLELYDLAHDPSEQQNLASREPERAKKLDVLLSKWLLGVGAKTPKPIPGQKDTTEINQSTGNPGRNS